jgi:hypothetical protein
MNCIFILNDHLILLIQIHKPVHIIGQSRVDNWQTSEKPLRSTIHQVIDRPVQVQGKSRIDTWQVTVSRRRTHSATEV